MPLTSRQTNVQIKTVFVGLFYSAIVPTGIIVTAVAMQTLYWVDKYSLLRLWKRPPVTDPIRLLYYLLPLRVRVRVRLFRISFLSVLYLFFLLTSHFHS